MSQPSIEIQSKVASEAAASFVEHYYDGLNRGRISVNQLKPFYASCSPRLASASVIPDISINGKHLEPSPSPPDATTTTDKKKDPSAAAQPPPKELVEPESLLRSQGSPVYYDVGSWDCQPVNPDFRLGLPENTTGGAASNRSLGNGDRVSFALQVSGTVKYGKSPPSSNTAADKDQQQQQKEEDQPIEKAFNESWILVPHWEALARNAPRGLRKWVVASQNFRAL